MECLLQNTFITNYFYINKSE
uniref:Uncharacterized protein n=1 Tax=Anguilla anguilla TaxID=7936 RepID=A0A0E9R2A6_ANGAN